MDKGTDESCAWEICRTQTPARKHCSNRINRVRFTTRGMLHNPDVWAAVEAVAHELIKRRTLDYLQVRSLVFPWPFTLAERIGLQDVSNQELALRVSSLQGISA